MQFREADELEFFELKEYLTGRNKTPRRISLYFHIPFCFSLCWYCGCTKVITKNQDRGDLYLEYLKQEMEQVRKILHPESEVVQIHFGGGTPTFLTPEQLTRLGEAIVTRFNTSEETEFGVEIDPRRCTKEHIQALSAIGCNRASLGVQNTNADVQQAIHRIQPFEQTVQVTEWLREEGIDSINFDLIYGLPRQSAPTFRKTMDDVLQLKADEMPSTDQKLPMLVDAISHFTAKGYRFIGTDHFSCKDEELTQAMDNGTLQRNFQGYSTLAGTDLYGIGMSAISNVGNWYWQNTKNLKEYCQALDENSTPTWKLLQLCNDNLIRKDAIMRIMCSCGLHKKEMEEQWAWYLIPILVSH